MLLLGGNDMENKINKDKVADWAADMGNKVKDVAIVVGDKAGDGAVFIGNKVHQAKIDIDKQRFNPVFPSTITSEDFKYPGMIRIVEYDKRMENEACEGAIGFENNIKGVRVLTIYRSCLDQINLDFYPSVTETIYYVHPKNTGMYIDLDEYFVYMRKARVNELEMAARDLGAKSVKITLKEQKKVLVNKNKKANGLLNLQKKGNVKAEMEGTTNEEDYANLDVLSDVVFIPHAPTFPELEIYKDDIDMKTLIDMRMKGNVESKTYQLSYSKTSGINNKIAAGIDAVLNAMDCSGNTSISSEVQHEERTILEYHIDF